MTKFNIFISSVNKKSLKDKILYGVIFCLTVSFVASFIGNWISIENADLARILTIAVFTAVIAFFMKDAVSYYDKVSGYEFTIFNPKKKMSYEMKRNDFLGGSVNNSDAIRDIIIIVLVLVASCINIKKDFPCKDEFIYFIRTTPVPVIFYYLISYFFKKSEAMTFFSKLELEKSVEEKRIDLVNNLREKYSSEKAATLPDVKHLTADNLREFMEDAKRKREDKPVPIDVPKKD